MADCPLSTALEMGNIDCTLDIGAFGRVLFQRMNQIEFETTDLTTKTGIDAKIAKTDSEKVIVSPKFLTPTVAAGDVIESDLDFQGIKIVTGENASTLTCMMRLTSKVYKQMKKLEGESLGIIIISDTDFIWAKSGSAAGKYKLIPIQTLFTKSVELAGHGEPDKYEVSFGIAQGWIEDLERLEATNYSPLFDLQNV